LITADIYSVLSKVDDIVTLEKVEVFILLYTE